MSTFTTERMKPEPEVTLRAFDLADLDDFYTWASDDRVSAWYRWDTYTSKEDLLDYMKNSVLPHPWMRAICYDGRPVGAISVNHFTASFQCRADLSYAIASQYWGKGIGTKAVKLVLGTIFGDMEGLKRLEAIVLLENAASQRVLEKAGFTKEGVFKKYLISKGKIRDVAIYSFFSNDN